MNKKGQMTGGLITGLIFGVASLVIAAIIAFVIVSTLTGAGLLNSARTTSTVTNETGHINATGYTLSGTSNNYVSSTFTLTKLYNATSGLVIDLDNATVTSNGVVSNASAAGWDFAKISYTYTLKSDEEVSTNGLSANFTAGINNVSSKIPTVLLVAAIVLILGVLAILVGVWQRMRMGGGTTL